MKKFDLPIREMLNKTLNISNLEKRLRTIESQYGTASPTEYEKILQNLSEIDIPKSIIETIYKKILKIIVI